MIRQGEDVAYEVDDDGGMLYNIQRMPSGGYTAQVRVWGQVTIDGRQYAYDRHVRVQLIRQPE